MTAEEWLGRYLDANGIDWNKLTLGERTQLTMLVPCAIRCWRVGGPVDVGPNEPCPECGQTNPGKNRYDMISEGWL